MDKPQRKMCLRSASHSEKDNLHTSLRPRGSDVTEIIENRDPNRNRYHTKNINEQPFSEIMENQYIAPLEKTSLESEEALDNTCNCIANSKDPCADSSTCINCATCVECDPNTCPAGARCQNQRFSKHQYPALKVCNFAERGNGLVTLVKLDRHQFVIEYVGEVINDEELQRRFKRMTKLSESNFYFLQLDKGMYIDGKRKGNLARFINHSCEPNCIAQRWLVKNIPVIGIFALKPINKNEELTFNYGWKTFNVDTPCLCGAEKCSGKVGKKM